MCSCSDACSPALALFTHFCTCGTYSSCAFSHSHVKLPSTFQQRADPHTPCISSHSFMSKGKENIKITVHLASVFLHHSPNQHVCMYITHRHMTGHRRRTHSPGHRCTDTCQSGSDNRSFSHTQSHWHTHWYLCERFFNLFLHTEHTQSLILCYLGSKAYPHTLLWVRCCILAHKTSHNGKSRWCSHSAAIHTRPPRSPNTHSHLKGKTHVAHTFVLVTVQSEWVLLPIQIRSRLEQNFFSNKKEFPKA